MFLVSDGQETAEKAALSDPGALGLSGDRFPSLQAHHYGLIQCDPFKSRQGERVAMFE